MRIPPMITANKAPSKLSHQWKDIIEKTIIYEDDFLLAINKPSGISVHSGSGRALGFIEALRLMHGPNTYFELIHRIDQATTGCLLIAKKRSYLKQMQQTLITR